MAKINNTSIFPIQTEPDDLDLILGTDISNTSNDPDGETVNFRVGDLSGGMKFLGTLTASGSATLDFDSSYFDATKFSSYTFMINNLQPSSGSFLWIRTSSDSGVSWDSAASSYSSRSIVGILSTVESSSNLDTKISLEANSSSTPSGMISGFVTLHNPSLASETMLTWSVYRVGGNCFASGGGERNSSDSVNGIRFLPSAGNFTIGTISMYGIRGS